MGKYFAPTSLSCVINRASCICLGLFPPPSGFLLDLLIRFYIFQICSTARLAAIRPRHAAPVIATHPVHRPSSCSALIHRQRPPISSWMTRRHCRMRLMFEETTTDPRLRSRIFQYTLLCVCTHNTNTHFSVLSVSACVCISSDYNIYT